MSNKINIDFQIYDSKDPKVFIILDTSEWAHIKDKPSIVEITLPGESSYITHYYGQNQVNVMTSMSLNLNCDNCLQDMLELPDGIYTITVKGSPDKFNKTKSYLRTTKTQLDLDKLFINLSLECSISDDEVKRKIQKLNEIQFLLKAAEANVRFDNTCVAHDLLSRAQKLISKQSKCKDCI